MLDKQTVYGCLCILLFITTTFSHALEKPRLWNIPTRNELYIKRTDLLQKVNTGLMNKDFVIIGMAGMGKTQLAKDYAHTYGKNYDLVWWFDANQDLLPQLRQLGQNLHGLKKCPMPDESQISQVKWMEAIQKCFLEHFPKSFFLIDDAKDNDQVKVIKDAFKTTPLLLTSRNQAIIGSHFMLKSFSRQESMEYLKKVLPRNLEASLNELAQTLNDYPLALTQAISYIKAHPSLSIEEYLSLYKEKRKNLWREEEKLTEGSDNEAALLEDYRRTVAATFALLLEELQKTSPQALEVLKFTSFLGSQDIPKRFLKIWLVDQQKRSDFDFHDATSALLKSSIFEKNENNSNQEETYNVHAVLHEYVRETLTKEERDFYIKEAATYLSNQLPMNSYKFWKTLFEDRFLEFHLESFLNFGEMYQSKLDDLLNLQIKYLHYLYFFKSDYKNVSKKLRNVAKEVEHNNRITPFEKARFYMLFGNVATIESSYDEAISISEKAERILSEIKSPEAQEELFLLLVNNLMDFYNVKGNLKKAEESGKKAEQLIPYISYPTYLTLYYCMRSFQLYTKGNFEEALKHIEIAISKYPSSDFPDYFHIFNKIFKAEILARLGKLENAIELLESNYKEYKKHYPNESNFKTLRMSIVKAFILFKQGKVLEADSLIRATISGLDKLFKKPDENPIQGFSHILLGEIYDRQNLPMKAQEEYKTAEDIYSHIFKTIEVDDISYLYKNFITLGIKMKDEGMIKKYLQLLTDHFGLDHPNTKEAVRYLDEHEIPAFS